MQGARHQTTSRETEKFLLSLLHCFQRVAHEIICLLPASVMPARERE